MKRKGLHLGKTYKWISTYGKKRRCMTFWSKKNKTKTNQWVHWCWMEPSVHLYFVRKIECYIPENKKKKNKHSKLECTVFNLSNAYSKQANLIQIFYMTEWQKNSENSNLKVHLLDTCHGCGPSLIGWTLIDVHVSRCFRLSPCWIFTASCELKS